MLSVIMLSIIMLCVITLNIVAPKNYAWFKYACNGALKHIGFHRISNDPHDFQLLFKIFIFPDNFWRRGSLAEWIQPDRQKMVFWMDKQMFLVDNLSRKVDFMQAQPNLSVCLSVNVCVRGKSFDVKNLIRPFQNHQKLKYILSIRCVATSKTI